MSALDQKQTCAELVDVCFVPIANIGHLFDHFVGARNQRLWHTNSERLGGFLIDDQLNFRCLLNRKLGRFFALKNPAGIDTR